MTHRTAVKTVMTVQITCKRELGGKQSTLTYDHVCFNSLSLSLSPPPPLPLSRPSFQVRCVRRVEQWSCALPPLRGCPPLRMIHLPHAYAPLYLHYIEGGGATHKPKHAKNAKNTKNTLVVKGGKGKTQSSSSTVMAQPICMYCARTPTQPAVCLACGNVMCCRDASCAPGHGRRAANW
jgi:hypothetical protein